MNPNGVDPKLMDAFQRVVMAGMKMMYSPQTRKMLVASLAEEAPVAEKVARAVAGLMKAMDIKANLKIPKQIIVPAAVALMMDLFKFMAQAGIEYQQEDVAKASGMLVQILVSEYRVMQAQGMGRLPQQAPGTQGMPQHGGGAMPASPGAMGGGQPPMAPQQPSPQGLIGA